MLAWEHSLGKRTSGIAQATVSQTPFEDLGLDELSETSIQLTLGFKRVVFSDQVLFAGITENVQNFDNTSDLGAHIGLPRAF